MGDIRVCYTNAATTDVSRESRLCPSSLPFTLSSSSSSSSSLSSSNIPDKFCSIPRESWERAEETARRIVWSVQPTLDAETKRKEIVEYVQRLIQDGLGYQVFPYGSVPFKTYLPDGDIDLTTLSSPPVVDTLVSDVYAILSGEEHNQLAPYEVKEVHCIYAEVKLVKCLVQNIVVDISFNQLGGLCTLCFLEQVDRLVGKDHLFKRSVILIKAWCYYESHILGAHHGLISTYALETLILYIFHLFHSSLDGPMAALYRFLDYFSKFDWENYCISLNGPVCKSSLPDIVAEVPENVGNDPLLSKEFLRKCINMFSVPSSGTEMKSQLFPLKHLNIIDPLKENNNLGRSVNRGNFYRIRSAFKYGARKLGHTLTLPNVEIEDKLVKFFANTLERHGSSYFANVQNIPLASDAKDSDHVIPSACTSTCLGNYLLAKSKYVGYTNNKILGSIAASGFRYKCGCPFNTLSLQIAPERETNVDKYAVSEYYHPWDAKDFLVSGGLLAMRSKSSSDHCSLSCRLGASLQAKLHVNKQNGRTEINNSSTSVMTDSIAAYGLNFALKPYSKKNTSATSNVVCKKELGGIFGDSESLKSLLDLTGDFDDHFWSVLYGQYCHLFSVSTSSLPSPFSVSTSSLPSLPSPFSVSTSSLPSLPSPPVSPHLQNDYHWETFKQCIPLKQEFFSQRESNGVLGQQICLSKPPNAVCPGFGSEDKKKRGTGTYFTNMEYYSNQEGLSTRKGNFHASKANSLFQRYTSSNGSANVQQRMTLAQEGSHELLLEEYPALGTVKSGSSNTHLAYQSVWCSSTANALSRPPERFESGSCRLELQSIDMSGDDALPESSTPCTCISTPSTMIPTAQSVKPVVDSNEESDAESYHLTSEHDFPSLSA